MPFFREWGSGSPKCRRITASNSSSDISAFSTTRSSPTLIAGAIGKFDFLYSSDLNSSRDLETISISISYFFPNLGIISLKWFQVLPLGSFRKNVTLSMFALPYYLFGLVLIAVTGPTAHE